MNYHSYADPDGEPPWRPSPPPEAEPAVTSHAAWARHGEPWSRIEEPYDGAVALYDLERPALSAGGTTRVLARFVAVRFLRIATGQAAPPRRMRDERAAAAAYADALRAPPAEANALRTIVQLARHAPPRRIMEFLHVAATHARASREAWGAFALHREAYRIAVAHDWHSEAARAASAIAGLAQEGGGRRSLRLWRLRARRQLFRAGLAGAQPGP
jgi:hypothetical protein